MVNIGLSALPKSAKYIAMVDADVTANDSKRAGTMTTSSNYLAIKMRRL